MFLPAAALAQAAAELVDEVEEEQYLERASSGHPFSLDQVVELVLGRKN